MGMICLEVGFRPNVSAHIGIVCHACYGNVEQKVNGSWNCKLLDIDPEPAAGSSDTDIAQPAATANQSATAVDAATGGCAGSAHEGRRLQCSAPHLSADNEDKAADL
jgi:hypothetical protein